MNIENQQFPTLHPDTPHRQIVEYPTLVDTVQLSVARTHDIEGSLNATTFSDIIAHKSDSEREAIINEIGRDFDDALVQFVVGSLTGRRNHEMIILADSAEGFNGHLPWESRLLGHIVLLQQHGLLTSVSVQVERYSTNYSDIKNLVDQAQDAQDAPFAQKNAA